MVNPLDEYYEGVKGLIRGKCGGGIHGGSCWYSWLGELDVRRLILFGAGGGI